MDEFDGVEEGPASSIGILLIELESALEPEFTAKESEKKFIRLMSIKGAFTKSPFKKTK